MIILKEVVTSLLSTPPYLVEKLTDSLTEQQIMLLSYGILGTLTMPREQTVAVNKPDQPSLAQDQEETLQEMQHLGHNAAGAGIGKG